LAAGWALISARSRRLALALALVSGVLILFYYVTFVFNNIEDVSNAFGAAQAGFWVTLVGGVGLAAQWFLPRQYTEASLPLSDLIPIWRKMTPMMRNEAVTFYVWISPWLIGFLIWQAWPVIESFYLAFTDFRLLNTPEFTGLANLEKLVNDDAFWKSLKVTVLYVIGAVPIGNIIALFVAMVLSQKLRGVNWWRTIYYLPSVVSQVAIAVMWSFVFNPDFGLMNAILDSVGVKGPGWIASENWALPSVIIIAWWATIGPAMIIYLAGLKGIPGVYYEAAEIDGATIWHQFRHITLPLLSPTIFFNVIVNIIGAFQAFDVPFVLTEGGPNRATTTYIYNLYEEGFIFTNMGYASLLAWVLFVIIVIFTLITIRISSSRVYYEAAVE
jgi:multiple sugar transport system permease protein